MERGSRARPRVLGAVLPLMVQPVKLPRMLPSTQDHQQVAWTLPGKELCLLLMHGCKSIRIRLFHYRSVREENNFGVTFMPATNKCFSISQYLSTGEQKMRCNECKQENVSPSLPKGSCRPRHSFKQDSLQLKSTQGNIFLGFIYY